MVEQRGGNENTWEILLLRKNMVPCYVNSEKAIKKKEENSFLTCKCQMIECTLILRYFITGCGLKIVSPLA